MRESLTSLCTWSVQQLNIMNMMGLWKNLITSAVVDNLDHNPSSTTALVLFMAQGYRCFKTECQGLTELCVANQSYNQVVPEGDTTTY